MSFALMLLFVIWLTLSAFLQAEDHPQKNYVSPALTAFCGFLLLVGTRQDNVASSVGWILFIALELLAVSDFLFERSVHKPDLFPLAMVFGVLSGFTIGVLFNWQAAAQGVPLWLHLLFLGVGIGATAVVYRYLQVEQALKIPVYIYLLQAIILITGGLSTLFAGLYHFAVWSIFIFLSDSLVGLRAFPNPQRAVPWLNNRRILRLIIVLYYPAQFALVTWAL